MTLLTEKDAWRAMGWFTPGDEPGDYALDNGVMVGLVSIDGETLSLHDVQLKDEAQRGKRSGAGRASLKMLRPLFKTIICDGALHPFIEDPANEVEAGILAFWVAMLREELVDRVFLLQQDVVIARRPPPPRKVSIVDRVTVPIEVQGIDIVALEKLSLVSHALAQKIGGAGGKEQTVLAGVLDGLLRQIKLQVSL